MDLRRAGATAAGAGPEEPRRADRGRPDRNISTAPDSAAVVDRSVRTPEGAPPVSASGPIAIVVAAEHRRWQRRAGSPRTESRRGAEKRSSWGLRGASPTIAQAIYSVRWTADSS